jgi:tripartite-type tricarboxylate transporter receptor subunit TctC
MPVVPRALLAAALLTFCAFSPASWGAQPYPAKPIRLLVPFAPGGIGDLTGRAVAQKMGEALGQQIIIDNRPSAGGIVATELVAKAAPDGYTLLLMNNTNAVSAALFRKLPYDTVRDFAMITTLGAFSIVMFVNPESPLRSVKDLIAHAKANPGKLNIGTINIGSTQHLSAELFKSMAGVEIEHVPFNSTGAVVTGLRGSNVQVAFEFLAPVLGQIKGGSLRALAVTPASRFTVLPDVPTVAESGLPGYEVTAWNGVAAPAGTPRAIIDRLNQEVHAAMNAPDLKKRFQELGVESNLRTPEASRAFLIADIAKWNGVIDKARIPRQ